MNATRRHRHRRPTQGPAAVLALALALPAAAAGTWQPPASIRDAAAAYAASVLEPDSDARVESAGVDARLRLPACGTALQTRTHGTFNGGRGTVAVSCQSPSPWQVFVPVRVFRMVDVAVASRPIGAGEIIPADAVRTERRSTAGLPPLYAAGPGAVVGQRARRTIGPGSIIQTSALNVMKAVERGASMTLRATRAGITVHGEGRALEDGGVGDRVRLQTPGGRVVEGIVESDSTVRIGG